MNFDKKYMRLYAVTDSFWLNGRKLKDDVKKALDGGATMLQLREKNMNDTNFYSEAIEIKELCHEYNVPFIINDNVEVALKCDADGVHIGQDDMSIKQAKRILGNKKIIGVSAHTVKEALEAQSGGADYLGVGAVFATSTKTDADIVDKQTLKDICSAVSIPVVAIGGITSQNILSLAGCRLDGVSVVSAVFAADDIKAETEKLLELSERMVKM